MITALNLYDWVCWKTKLKGEEIFNYGMIYAIVPPYVPITKKILGEFTMKSGYEDKTRNVVSYLIAKPNETQLSWPATDQLNLLDSHNWHRIYNDVDMSKVNRNDRYKLLATLQLLYNLFGDNFEETDFYIESFGVEKRFWFAIYNNVEYIARIEDIRRKKWA